MSAETVLRLFRRTETGARRVAGVPLSLMLIIGALAAAHAYRVSLPDGEGHRLLLEYAFFPLDFSGAASGPVRFWTALSYPLVHTSWIEVAVYCVWMLAFSGVVVQRLGTSRFLVLCAVSAIAGAGAHLAAYWEEPVLLTGAAAAVSGQIACAIRFLFSRPSNLLQVGRMHREHLRPDGLGRVFRKPATYVFLGVWAALQVAFWLTGAELAGFERAIAWPAVAGGFVAGLVVFPLLDFSRN